MPITGAEHVGFTFASLMSMAPSLAPELARQAQDLGYGSFWTAETVGVEAFSLLGAAGAAAPGIGLGTGVLALQLRTPQVVAMAGATLQALHPDVDVIIGVGISSPVVTQRWHGVPYGDRPLARVREYVTLVKQCLTGESVSFEGDFYECSRYRLGVRLGDRKPKVVVGALNPGMLALAGEVADGVLLNYLPHEHVAWSVEQVRRGGDATIYAYVHVGVGDPHDGRTYAQRDLFGYAVVDAYAKNFERAGFGADVAAVRERHAAGDRDAAHAAVSDDFIQAIDFMGTPDEVTARVQAYVDAGVQVPVIMPMPWGPDRRAVIDATMRAGIGA
jgi:probable F420-dependent oxidoreductase